MIFRGKILQNFVVTPEISYFFFFCHNDNFIKNAQNYYKINQIFAYISRARRAKQSRGENFGVSTRNSFFLFCNNDIFIKNAKNKSDRLEFCKIHRIFAYISRPRRAKRSEAQIFIVSHIKYAKLIIKKDGFHRDLLDISLIIRCKASRGTNFYNFPYKNVKIIG